MLRPGTIPAAAIVATLALLVMPAMAIESSVSCDSRASWFVAYGQDDDKCRLTYELASISCGMMAPCAEEEVD